MHFRVGGDRNVEWRHSAQTRDQLRRITIAARMRLVLRSHFRRVAAKRDDTADAERPILVGDRIDLLTRGSNAGQVRRRRQRGSLENTLGRGAIAFAGRSARAVVDRNEARLKWLESLDRLPQSLLHLFALGREEFEADLDVAARLGEERQVPLQVLERVHAALRCGTAAFTPRHSVTVSSPPSRCWI